MFVRYNARLLHPRQPRRNGSFRIPGDAAHGSPREWAPLTTWPPSSVPRLPTSSPWASARTLIPHLPILNNPTREPRWALSFQALYPAGVLADQGPSVSVRGANYISNTPSFGSNNPNFADNTNFNWIDNLAKVMGSHTLTFGFAARA